jgi:hypothetical protein
MRSIAAPLGLALGIAMPAAALADNVNACTVFAQKSDVDQKIVTFTFENRCEHKLSCTLTFSVTCEGAEPKQSLEGFTLDVDQKQHFEASAQSCSGGWRIDPPKWQCQQTD